MSADACLRSNSIIPNADTKVTNFLPEIEVGLGYDSKQSILAIEIGKGSNFRLPLECQAQPPGT